MWNFIIFYMAMTVVTEAVNFILRDSGRCPTAMAMILWPIILLLLIGYWVIESLNDAHGYGEEYWWRK